MVIGERIRVIRESKKLSQGEIQKRTGLLRCYISRVEHGHTVPTVETVEKIARAVDVPLYRFFCEDNMTPQPLRLPPKPEYDRKMDSVDWQWLAQQLRRMSDKDRETLFFIAKRMARRKRRRSTPAHTVSIS